MNTTISTKPLLDPHTLTLRDLQLFNKTVYETANNRYFETYQIACRLMRFTARALHKTRNGKPPKSLGYYFLMMLSWLAALANRLNLPLAELVDSHCGGFPPEMPLAELQITFRMIHLNANLDRSALCLSEKVMEVVSTLEYFIETHENGHLTALGKRMAQATEAIIVTASILDLSLACEFSNLFSEGCNACHHIPCGCTFRHDKVL